jgi:hypothetical protein
MGEGIVSGDAGAGLFAGEVLAIDTSEPNITTLDVLYQAARLGAAAHGSSHGGPEQQQGDGKNQGRGRALRGKRVRGDYQVITPCPILNTQSGFLPDVCFQGTPTIGPDEH